MSSIDSTLSDLHANPPRAPLTAFVFSGGGSLGAIEVGMLRELLNRGEHPGFVVGASAGAINAAYFAGSPNRDGVAMLESLWCRIRRQDIMPFSMLGLLDMVLRRRPHLVEATALRMLLEKNLSFMRVEQAALPLHVVATDVLSGNEIVISSGPVVDAVLASAAIPGVFPPVAIALGATRVIVLPAGFACALRAPPASAIAQAMHALTLVIARQLVRDLEFYTTRADIFVVPPLCPLDISPYDYTQCDRLIDRAAETTRAWLDGGGLERAFIPGELRQHSHTAH
jgi:NTE family protein